MPNGTIDVWRNLRNLSDIASSIFWSCESIVTDAGTDVQVVAIRIDHIETDLIDLMVNFLSKSEKYRFESFKNPLAAINFLAGRYIVRRFISETHGIIPGNVEITVGKNGKPHNEFMNFNISHSRGFLVAAFGNNCDIGIDVESASQNVDLLEIAKAVLPEEEINSLVLCDESIRLGLFLEKWTFHEARIKMDALTIDHIKYHKSNPFKGWTLEFNLPNVKGCLCCRKIDIDSGNPRYSIL